VRRSKLPDQAPEQPPGLGPRHAAVKRLRELLRDARTRSAERAFVVEGPRAIDAALDRGARFETVYFGPNAEVAFPALTARVTACGSPVAVLKEGVLEKVGTTRTPQPVLGVVAMPDVHRRVLASDGLVIMGVALADPGNLGTLIRSAEAAGAAAILLGPGSVDAYNPKVVRASAGAIFGLPVVDAVSEGWSAVDALDALGELGRQRLGATAGADATPYPQVDFTRPTAVVLGNEAHGLGPDLDAHLDGRVTIPMTGPAESLNVAVAGSVLCFESARQRARGGAE